MQSRDKCSGGRESRDELCYKVKMAAKVRQHQRQRGQGSMRDATFPHLKSYLELHYTESTKRGHGV